LFAVSIVEFKRAKLLQEAKLSGITVTDFDAGSTSVYLNKAEALLELATEFAQERRQND
jgi:hypothetical protein